MQNRRTFLTSAALVAGVAILDGGPLLSAEPLEKQRVEASDDLTRYVNVLLGTGGHGHTFPGATVPFGAVQLSPDTGVTGWDRSSGYHHDDATLMGFSHTHLSGTGVGDMLDLLLVPRTGDVVLEAGLDDAVHTNSVPTYRSRFSHADELAEPGYYRVLTESAGGQKITSELTATERTGLAKFTFPPNEPAYVLIDWHHAYGVNSPVKSAELTGVSDTLLTGGRRVSCWAPDREICFASEISPHPTKMHLFSDDKTADGPTIKGSNLKAVLHFPAGTQVMVKTGISMVSAANALENLRAEQPGFDFVRVREAAKRSWQTELARIRVEDANEEHKTIFYSSLYHMMCAPTLADDVNGQYRGFDKQVHQLAGEQHNYSTYSLWDTYRALHPSFTIWQRQRVAPLVNCLIRIAEQSIYGFPIWPLQDGETYCMPGYHAASVMAEACVKNVRGIDWQRAYAAMRKRNMVDDYMGLPLYRNLGYLPADKVYESVGKLVEYSYCDWACSHVAEATGHAVDAKVQRDRSQNYKNVFDPNLQFIRPKLSNGDWAPKFDPKATGHIPHHRDYTEANAWQTTFFVQHDVKGYMNLFGGRDSFAQKLDALFTETPGVSNESVADMTGFIGQYVHGNEPSHHISYLYVWAGQPWKTQERVREILLTHYRNNFDGLDGNEDCGQMSAWYVMSALGLYAVDPVSATYVMSAPLFDKVTIALDADRKIIIETKRSNPEDKYIQSVLVNGKQYEKLWISHAELIEGTHLVFELGPEPERQLGVAENSMPPSLTA